LRHAETAQKLLHEAAVHELADKSIQVIRGSSEALLIAKPHKFFWETIFEAACGSYDFHENKRKLLRSNIQKAEIMRDRILFSPLLTLY